MKQQEEMEQKYSEMKGLEKEQDKEINMQQQRKNNTWKATREDESQHK
jgi:hypothetical protein